MSASAARVIAGAVDPDARWLYRVGGISALVFGVAYILIFPLYASVGAPPGGGEAWLTYAAGKTTVWWTILGLSVLTDVLLAPVALSLYLALKGVDRNVALVATSFVGMFIVLDLAVTWPNLAALIALTDQYAAATTDAHRAAAIAAATYATAVLTSTLAGIYSIVSLSLGILMVSLVMLRGNFSGIAGYVGLATGILGIVSVAGPFLVGAFGESVIVASVLTTAWAFVSGYRLYRLGQH